MSGSGLIYAAIAIMWAAVLIPMWLRNHDTAAENRSAERFGQAMRVLSRKEQDDVTETPAEPARPALPAQRPRAPRVERTVAAPKSRPEPRPAARPAARAAARPTARRPRSLTQRRARTLGVLVGLTAFLAMVAVVSPIPWWVPLPFAVLSGAFVVHLRIQAREQQHRRSGNTFAAKAGPTAEKPAETASDSGFEHPASGFDSGSSRAVVVETKGSRSSDAVTFDSDETWRPNPLPLPTYVTAPKAVRPIKVIDLTSPGAWSSGRLLDDDLSDEDLLAAEVADAELDALLAQEVAPPATATGENDEAKRRAVGD